LKNRRNRGSNIDADWLPRGLSGAVTVLTAFAIDHIVGEPPPSWHPVVWIGRALSVTGAPWPLASPSSAFVRGLAVWLAGAAVSMALAAMACGVIAHLANLGNIPWPKLIAAALLGVLLKPLFAWRLLHDEVAAVERALADGLAAGREQLRRLVSRDTADLTATEIRESAIETLAENLNDSLIAPLFWFVLGGLPGAALYRFANTADAMWGYRGRWEWAGKWAARADDVLSYLPARLTAALLAIAALRRPRGLRREARLTPSPNGGWPMAMLALALNVRLSKRGVYVLHAEGREAAAEHSARGLIIATRAAWWAVVLTSAALFLL
jgi:adenosylcobinamide-phosphate synthase